VALSKEYWTIYRGPGFLAVVWFNPLPLSRQQVVSLSQSSCVSPVELTKGRGRAWGRGRSQFIRRRESLVFYKSIYTVQYSLALSLTLPPPLKVEREGGHFKACKIARSPLYIIIPCRVTLMAFSSGINAPVLCATHLFTLRYLPENSSDSCKGKQGRDISRRLFPIISEASVPWRN